jgi:hypothetical protein
MNPRSESTPEAPVKRDRRLARRGSVPLTVHGIIEYAVGVLSIAAPFMFNFDSNGATVISALLGAGILVLAVMTASPTGIVRSLPIESHVVIDYVISLFMIVVPFLFSFTDDGAATAYFLVVGVAYLLLTITTRYHKPVKQS